jgi:hypothetical protein
MRALSLCAPSTIKTFPLSGDRHKMIAGIKSPPTKLLIRSATRAASQYDVSLKVGLTQETKSRTGNVKITKPEFFPARVCNECAKNQAYKERRKNSEGVCFQLVKKWCARRDDLRTFLGEFLSSLPQVLIGIEVVA